MTFAMCNEQSVDSTQIKAIVRVVGIKPDFWNTEGRFNIAGPVNEFTAIDTLPSIPMVPIRDNTLDYPCR